MSGEYDDFEQKVRLAQIATEADAMWLKDVAQRLVGMGAPDRWKEAERSAMLLCMVGLATARTIEAAIRDAAAKIEAAILDAGTENAGAIDSMGTVIGAALAEGLQGLCKG